jgi:hypothetical protein
MTPTELRIDLAERQVAQKNWQNLDVQAKVELITRHYVTHAKLCQQLLAVVMCKEPIEPDILEMVKRLTKILVQNHIKTFGVDPSWNSL